jgi:hypothetical protein
MQINAEKRTWSNANMKIITYSSPTVLMPMHAEAVTFLKPLLICCLPSLGKLHV